MSEPRILRLHSGTHEVLPGVFVTINWEGEPGIIERLIYVDGADEPSVILQPAVPVGEPYEFVWPFLHGWLWWPYSLRRRRGGFYVRHWTDQHLAHARAMAARTR